VTDIYHITHIDNLSNIVAMKAILAQSRHRGFAYTNIAHANIQMRRANRVVPIAPGSHLHDYVPFYFAPRSPMLCAISHGRVEGYSGGQKDVVYFVSSAEIVQSAGLRFVFSDGHAAMDFSEFYGDLADLNRIDWNIMCDRYWRDTEADNDRSRRRQAEFLVHYAMPLSLVTEVAAMTATAAAAAGRLLAQGSLSIPIATRADWYYH
jgi:hypothetical protein